MKNQLRMFMVLIGVSLCACAQLSGVPQTPQIKALEQKAYSGDLDSQYQLGMKYTINGRWGWDYQRGYNWFLTAAERGHVDAQYMVGMVRLLGRGTSFDRKIALNFFSMAAEKGHARAQYQVGIAFLNGSGVEKDQPWGRQWLEQAAWNGHQEAQFLLAAIFSDGIGGQPNRSEAWMWLKRAAQEGHDNAGKALSRLQSKMSDEELTQGKKLLGRRPGMVGRLYKIPRIRYVQTVLNQLGYRAGPEDGLEGISTGRAVTEYARQNKLPPETQVLGLVEALRGSY